jgi:tRNA-2-methylthio-N6-dimethylallyladenosine synthase
LAQIDGLRRIRFLSPHPADFTPALLETIARHRQVCRHLHLPLQAGADRILTAMRRGYTRADFLALVHRARAHLPGLAITTDIIVGFPGEREEDFAETLAVMREVEFDQAFMFAYSPRPGTYAARALEDDVADSTKRKRLQSVIALQEEHSRKRFAGLIGTVAEVLVEGPARAPAGHWFGRTDDFKDTIFDAVRVGVPRPGSLVHVAIAAATSHTRMGSGTAS